MMYDSMIFRDLIANVALMLALSFLYGLLVRSKRITYRTRPVISGLLFGGMAVSGMLIPFHLGDGVFLDGRSIVLSMAGFFGGWITGSLAVLIAIIFRIIIGGSGMIAGIGLALTSTAFGLGYRAICRKFPRYLAPLYSYFFGILVHAILLIWMVALPRDLPATIIRSVALPVTIIFPLGTLFMATLLKDQEQRLITETKLRRSEARYRSLFTENLSVLLIIHPESAAIEDANKAACDYYGWPYDEITGMNITQVANMNSDSVLDELQDAKNGIRESKIMEHRLASGEIRAVEVFSGPIMIDDQVLVYSIVRDITERNEAEQALKESQRRFWELMETVDLIAVMLDVNGTITFCNQYLLDLTGWEYSETIGGNWFERFIAPEIREGLEKEVFERTFKEGVVKPHHINEIVTHDGDRRLISWNNTVFRDLDGQVIGTTSLGEDITDRLLAEEAILRRNQELAVLVDIGQRLLEYRERKDLLSFIVNEIVRIIPGAEAASLWEFDEDISRMVPLVWYGHKDEAMDGLELDPTTSLVGKVYRTRQVQNIANTNREPSFASLGKPEIDSVKSVIGVPLKARDEVIGALFIDNYSQENAFSEKDLSLLESVAYQASLGLENARLFKQISVHAEELEQRIAERTEELHQRVVEVEHLNRGMINITEDIQRVNQQVSAAANRLTIANEELEAFAYSVSHDLRAPLRGIRGFSGILAERHRDDLNEQGREYIDYVVNASNQMVALMTLLQKGC